MQMNIKLKLILKKSQYDIYADIFWLPGLNHLSLYTNLTAIFRQDFFFVKVKLYQESQLIKTFDIWLQRTFKFSNSSDNQFWPQDWKSKGMKNL